MKRAIVKLLIVALLFSLPRIAGTHAFYSDMVSSTGNQLSTGWWITPDVKVTSPDGGEIWISGSTHDITWTAVSSDPAGTINTVDILLSTDGGATYSITLASGLANTGVYPWTIGVKSTTMKVKIVATDNHSLVGSDESNNIFDPAEESVFTPNPTTTPDSTLTPTPTADSNPTLAPVLDQAPSATSTAELTSEPSTSPKPTEPPEPSPTPSSIPTPSPTPEISPTPTPTLELSVTPTPEAVQEKITP